MDFLQWLMQNGGPFGDAQTISAGDVRPPIAGQQPGSFTGAFFYPRAQLDPSQVQDMRWLAQWRPPPGVGGGDLAQWYYDPIHQWQREIPVEGGGTPPWVQP